MIVLVDDCDRDLLELSWQRHPGGHLMRKVHRRTVYLHREIMRRVTGAIPRGMVVDHANGDTLDNRRSNLRLATVSQNVSNQKKHKDNRSGFKGVTWSKHAKMWRAQICVQYKNKNLGYFKTPEEAHAAYCTAAKILHGAFARFK